MYHSHSFQQQGQTHAAADAQRCESKLRLTLLHLVNQRGRDSHAGAADRVAQRDGAAVDVQTFRVKSEFAIAGDDLGCEGFVQLDEIDLVQRQVLTRE